jgi:GT2 family glycosyltransferase
MKVSNAGKLFSFFKLFKNAALVLSQEGTEAFVAKTKDYFVDIGLMRTPYERWLRRNRLTKTRVKNIKADIETFQYKPKFSIIMPVYNVDQIWLQKAIDSVRRQYYENWELCIVDDGSSGEHIKQVLSVCAAEDFKIFTKHLHENRGISKASNEALKMATGDYVTFLDHDDEITEDALYQVAKVVNDHKDVNFVYSDEDKISEIGVRHDPFFKPDWSPDTFRSYNYICHLAVIKRSLVKAIGGFREGFDGSQDYDLFLRALENQKSIVHIPKVIYHWRTVKQSIAKCPKSKPYAYANAKRALTDHLRRIGLAGEVHDGPVLGTYRVKYHVNTHDRISIVITTRDKALVLKRCLDSILSKTSYPEYNIIIINNGSMEEETLEYFDILKNHERIFLYDLPMPFNFSKLNNFALSKIDTEHIVFLNNDTEVISADWLHAMLEFNQRDDVGAVGALLYYPDDTIQHGGVILGIGGVAGHSHKYFPRSSVGCYFRLKIIQNLSAVTAACVMTKKSVLNQVGRFDENLSHAFNDIDLCLRIRQMGYLIVYTPYAQLYHHESLSRGKENTPQSRKRFQREVRYFQSKWKELLAKGDPYYNPNLTLKKEDFSIRI